MSEILDKLLSERAPVGNLVSMDEIIGPGINLMTDEEYEKEYEATPPCFRFLSTELEDNGIKHLLRIRKEFWPNKLEK
jgi:hypothetical protein